MIKFGLNYFIGLDTKLIVFNFSTQISLSFFLETKFYVFMIYYYYPIIKFILIDRNIFWKKFSLQRGKFIIITIIT